MEVKTSGTQKEAKIVSIPSTARNQTLHYSVDYDTLNPEKVLGDFLAEAREMVKRYEYNEARIREIEIQLIDLEHFIEIAPNQTVPKGYKLYKEIAELRRERRSCKNENDILRAVHDYFHSTAVLGKLNTVYNDVSKAKEIVNSRYYTIRTGVLDDYIEHGPPVERIGLNLLTGETCIMEGSDNALSL